jgi:soluble cytochrome b562
MYRILVVAALLTVMTTNPSRADIFKCQLPDGSTFFTDSPELASADCKMQRVTELPVLGVMQGSPAAPASTTSSASSSPSGKKGQEAKTFAAFKSEVDLLAEQFKSSQRRAWRGRVANKQEARRELKDVREQKQQMQGAISQSALSTSEKQELLGTLATITE